MRDKSAQSPSQILYVQRINVLDEHPVGPCVSELPSKPVETKNKGRKDAPEQVFKGFQLQPRRAKFKTGQVLVDT